MYFKNRLDTALNQWWQMPMTPLTLPKLYSSQNDRALKKLRSKIDIFLVNGQQGGWSEAEGEVLQSEGKAFMIEVLGVSPWAVEALDAEDYVKCSKAFIERAKGLVPDLSVDGLFQALRNVWTMNSMQVYLGLPVELTDSIFAYSMLYPLTDNYLDCPKRSRAEKIDFNKRFREKIRTGEAVANTDEEVRIFSMIDLIAAMYPRSQYPKVFEGLLAILDGQNMSIDQQGLTSVHAVDLLGITFYKGGSSVLADAYLVGGVLTPDQEQFAFDYGVVLQLADDLQDIAVDLKAKHATIFNQQVGRFGRGKLDDLANKYLRLMTAFQDNHFKGDDPKVLALKELIGTSLNLLVMSALLSSRRLLTREMARGVKDAHVFSRGAYQSTERRLNKHLYRLAEACL